MAAADAHNDPPAPPTPVGPVDATVVDGQEVTFAWKPSDEADRYRLQIAETTRFEELVLDEEVGNETAVTVGNQLPTDGQTFFWRVIPGSLEEWGTPSVVESFIVGTEEASEQDLTAPEGTGPITGLARAAKREVTRRVPSFEDRFEEEREQGVAYEGIAANQIMAIAVSILVVILIAVAVLFGWYGQVTQETRAAAASEQNYEMLQQSEMEARQELTQYGVENKEKNVYQIPIDRAMDVIATEEYQRGRAAPDAQSAQTREGSE
jgi:hypothetical protein